MEPSGDTDETQSDGLLDILKANGEEHLYGQIMELTQHEEDETPTLIFGWNNVDEFVKVIQLVQAQGPTPPAPPPFELPSPLNRKNFKEALLNYVRIEGAPAPVDTTALPCSMVQYGQTMCKLARLQCHPWIQHIIEAARAEGTTPCLPLAIVYVHCACSNTLEKCASPVPDSLWYA